MTVQRFYDETVQQLSYIVHDDGRAVIIDPARNVAPYLDYLEKHDSSAVAVVMTHRPATFASGWAELRRRTGAKLYAGSAYGFHGPGEFELIDRVVLLRFGGEGTSIRWVPTPGFTADSVSGILTDGDGDPQGIFTGAAIINDGCGYPLPRPEDKNPLSGKKTYAAEMYRAAHKIIKGFNNRVPVYAGLVGKNHFTKSEDRSHVRFSLAEEQQENPIFLEGDETRFITWLLEDYPYVPHYFGGCQQHNQEGGYADYLAATLTFSPPSPAAPPQVTALPTGTDTWIIDTRKPTDFHAAHAANAVNIALDGPFALRLGSVVKPGEPIFLLTDDPANYRDIGDAVAKIGYDDQVAGVGLYADSLGAIMDEPLDTQDFEEFHASKYTVVDVRPPHVARTKTKFHGALNVPFWELRDKYKTIPQDRPIVVHCNGGHSSAIAASLLTKLYAGRTRVYDLGAAAKDYKPAK